MINWQAYLGENELWIIAAHGFNYEFRAIPSILLSRFPQRLRDVSAVGQDSTCHSTCFTLLCFLFILDIFDS